MQSGVQQTPRQSASCLAWRQSLNLAHCDCRPAYSKAEWLEAVEEIGTIRGFEEIVAEIAKSVRHSAV